MSQDLPVEVRELGDGPLAVMKPKGGGSAGGIFFTVIGIVFLIASLASGKDLITTLALSLLPLVVVGMGIYNIVKTTRERDLRLWVMPGGLAERRAGQFTLTRWDTISGVQNTVTTTSRKGHLRTVHTLKLKLSSGKTLNLSGWEETDHLGEMIEKHTSAGRTG